MFEWWYTNFTLPFFDSANFFRYETWHWVCFVDTSITFKPNFAFVNSMMSRVPFGGVSSQYRILLWQIVPKCCFIQVLGISAIVRCHEILLIWYFKYISSLCFGWSRSVSTLFNILLVITYSSFLWSSLSISKLKYLPRYLKLSLFLKGGICSLLTNSLDVFAR